MTSCGSRLLGETVSVSGSVQWRGPKSECAAPERTASPNRPAVPLHCRSKTASSALAELGYTDVSEFGSINTWPYEPES